MKKSVLFLLIPFALFSPASAQQKKTSPSSFIEVSGVKLRIGMAKADVAEQLAGAQILKQSPDEWYVVGAGNVRFKNGRLVYADRSWIKKDVDPVDALFGLVSSLNREGYTSCAVSADMHTAPGSTFERVWIDCGPKSVLIMKGKVGDDSIEDILERLGTND